MVNMASMMAKEMKTLFPDVFAYEGFLFSYGPIIHGILMG